MASPAPVTVPAPVPATTPVAVSWVDANAFTNPKNAHKKEEAEYICKKAGKELKRIGKKFDSIKIVYVAPPFYVDIFLLNSEIDKASTNRIRNRATVGSI